MARRPSPRRHPNLLYQEGDETPGRPATLPPSHQDLVVSYSMAFAPALFNRKPVFVGDKCAAVQCQNSYQYFVAKRLDADPAVHRFHHHGTGFKFVDPFTGKVRRNSYDFTAFLLTRAIRLVYIAPCKNRHTHHEEAQIEAAEAHAHDIGAEFALLTEIEIFGPNPAYMQSVIPYILDRRYERFRD